MERSLEHGCTVVYDQAASTFGGTFIAVSAPGKPELTANNTGTEDGKK